MNRSSLCRTGRYGSRQRFKSTPLVCLLGLVAAACAGNGSDSDSKAGGQEDRKLVPAARQELVVGTDEDDWVDAERDRKRLPSYPLNADVCETLVRLTPDFQVAEGLASDWEFVGDNTFRFALREDPTFSDGRPLTAGAVKYTMDYTAQEPATSGFSFIGPESTTVVDERTVDIRPAKPNLRLVQQITHPTYTVLAPGSDPLNDPNVTCTGPFKVVEYVPGERLVVERNDDYWAEPAKLDKITFRFIPDETTRTLALQNGEVDLITDVPRSILSTVEAFPDIEIAEAPVGQVILMYVARRDASGSDKLLSDPVLRRAVAHAMNRETYVEGVLDGNGELVSTVSPPAVLGDSADLVEGIPYDPDEATRLLDEAGWRAGPDGMRSKDGRPLEVTIIFGPGRIDQATVEFVQAQLQAVGIAGKVDQLDAGAYSERWDAGDYDLNLSSPNQNDANPAFIMSFWHSESSFPLAKPISPGPDTEFDRLMDQTQQATDEEELRRLSAEAMHELVDVEVGAIPLAGTYRIYAMKERVEGLDPHPSGTNQRWSTVFLSE